MSANQWRNIRVVLLCMAAVCGAATGLLPTDIPFAELAEMPVLMKLLLASVVLLFLAAIPLIVAVVILLQSANPFSDKTWERPTHHSNPFWIGNPLLFFHFASYAALAGATGMLLTSFFTGSIGRVVYSIVGMAGSSGSLAGVHLAMWLVKDKMEPPRLNTSYIGLDNKEAGSGNDTERHQGDVNGKRESRRNSSELTLRPMQITGLNEGCLYETLRVIRYGPLLLVLLGVVFGYTRWRRVQRSVVVKATIVEFAAKDFGDGTMHAPVYAFEDETGRSIRAHALAYSSSPRGAVGDTNEVLYDPSDPDTVIENNMFDIWAAHVVFITAGLSTFIVLSVVVKILRGRLPYCRERQSNRPG